MIAAVLLSIAGLLRLILIIIGVIFLIRLITYLVLPHIMNKAARQMQDHMEAINRSRQPERKEGEVSITPPGKAKPADPGEFTPFTEIKD